MKPKEWFIQVAVAVDQLANAVLRGYADETLSSRSYRMWRDKKRTGWMMHCIDALFFWQKLRPDARGHCHEAYLNEHDRQGMPPEFRKPKE